MIIRVNNDVVNFNNICNMLPVEDNLIRSLPDIKSEKSMKIKDEWLAQGFMPFDTKPVKIDNNIGIRFSLPRWTIKYYTVNTDINAPGIMLICLANEHEAKMIIDHITLSHYANNSKYCNISEYCAMQNYAILPKH